MSAKYFELDPEYRQVLEADPAQHNPTPAVSTPHELRAHLEAEFEARPQAPPDDVVVSEKSIHIRRRKEPLPVYIFGPRSIFDDRNARGPGAVYVHGGGFVAGSVGKHFQGALAKLALEAGMVIIAPEYRLAPEHPSPAPIDDVIACLDWVMKNSGMCRVDINRVGLVGVSAGGAIAIAAALGWASNDRRMRDWPPVAKLILASPMLDDRTVTHPDDWMNSVHTWTSTANMVAWRAYLRGESAVSTTEESSRTSTPEKPRSPAARLPTRPWAADWGVVGTAVRSHRNREDWLAADFAVPARVQDLHLLPRTYIDVGGADLFKDECVRFVNRLVDANVETEFHMWPGVPHGWNGRAPNIRLARVARESQIRAMTSI